MPGKKVSEPPSLRWIHEVRRKHYQRTKNLPLEAWLPEADPGKTVAACEQLGLKIRAVAVRKDEPLRTQG